MASKKSTPLPIGPAGVESRMLVKGEMDKRCNIPNDFLGDIPKIPMDDLRSRWQRVENVGLRVSRDEEPEMGPKITLDMWVDKVGRSCRRSMGFPLSSRASTMTSDGPIVRSSRLGSTMNRSSCSRGETGTKSSVVFHNLSELGLVLGIVISKIACNRTEKILWTTVGKVGTRKTVRRRPRFVLAIVQPGNRVCDCGLSRASDAKEKVNLWGKLGRTVEKVAHVLNEGLACPRKATRLWHVSSTRRVEHLIEIDPFCQDDK